MVAPLQSKQVVKDRALTFSNGFEIRSCRRRGFLRTSLQLDDGVKALTHTMLSWNETVVRIVPRRLAVTAPVNLAWPAARQAEEARHWAAWN